MNWQTLINDLEKVGLTQKMMASACGTTQSVISDLKNGKHKSCKYEVGKALIDIHKKFKRSKPIPS